MYVRRVSVHTRVCTDTLYAGSSPQLFKNFFHTHTYLRGARGCLLGGASGRGRGRTAIVGGDCGLCGSQTAGGGHSAREFHTRPLGSGPEEGEGILMNL